MGETIEQTIPSKPLEWTGERQTSKAGWQAEIEHLHRYLLARDHCRGLDVLDVAAGDGHGTALLAQVARSATGVASSGEAVAHAAREHVRSNLRYLQGDARKIPMDDASVDIVVSYDTIAPPSEQDAFLSEIKRVLRPGGRLMMSSPNGEAHSPVRGSSRLALVDLVGRHFDHVQLLAQRPISGSMLVADGDRAGATATLERRGGTQFERSDGVAQAPHVLVVASDASLEPMTPSVFVDSGEIATRTATTAAEAPQSEPVRLLLQQANKERDLARAALRRAAIQAGLSWKERFAVMSERASEAERRSRMLADQLIEARAEAALWRGRYDGLRGRLEGFIRRFGLLRLLRLVPGGIRRSMRDAIIPPGQM